MGPKSMQKKRLVGVQAETSLLSIPVLRELQSSTRCATTQGRLTYRCIPRGSMVNPYIGLLARKMVLVGSGPEGPSNQLSYTDPPLQVEGQGTSHAGYLHPFSLSLVSWVWSGMLV